jgi:NADPH-ferrihemoprotein reductase
MDIDIRGSGLVYETGDHVAVWPSNSDIEVDRFLRVFGLIEKRHNSIQIKPTGSIKQHIPSPTTYDAAARYYLEICGPVSRQFVGNLSAFASNSHQKENLLKLAKNTELFGERITSNLFNIAQLIESISPDCPVFPIPFEVLLEGVRHLQPRYYSISSSSLVDKDIISLTTVVESVKVSQHLFKGVSSNYLLAIKRAQNGEQLGQNESPYAVNGPRYKYKNASVPIHVRHSSFKLPHDSAQPIVMIGPGTGVAPFRAFVQERVKQVQSGINVGKMILFFGCRNDQDFIYREDWKVYDYFHPIREYNN